MEIRVRLVVFGEVGVVIIINLVIMVVRMKNFGHNNMRGEK